MFEGYEELTAAEQERMQEVIRLLWSQTFLLERKYDKKGGRLVSDKNYDFCDRHREFLTDYFAVAGIRLQQDTELGVIYIQGAEGIGEKLPKLATIYLLLLKLIYDEKMAAVSSSVNIVTTFGELNGKVGEFRLARGLSSVTEIRRAFSLLRKYQMVEFLDLPEELNENTRIIIYPCINLVLMREDIEGLLRSFEEEDALEKSVSKFTEATADDNADMEETEGEALTENAVSQFTEAITDDNADMTETGKEALAQNGAEKETAEMSSIETDSTETDSIAADSAEMEEIQKEADHGTAEAGV